jgi:D-3-phosphoglycerate dehydrogenase
LSLRILVLEGITERGAEILRSEGWVVDMEKALPPAELCAKVPPYHAILVRSGSQMNAQVIEAAKSLRVIGRAGVGVDNVDLQAATRRGVLVMNSPGGNSISTAELAVALMLALARNLSPADTSMKAGAWDRKSFAGVELHGKRLGVIGFGRIGREVASRCRAFGMEVQAFDPFVSPAVAEAAHVALRGLDEVIQTSDYLTLHTTLTPETRHLIGKDALSKVKVGVRIVNAARGELVDDEALLAALDGGRVAGAALDVHAQEPPKDWRLAKHPKVLALPHLGASTREAQERVGTDIAQQVRDFLKGGVIQSAVNFYSLAGDLYDKVRPAMDLAERLGLFLSQACRGSLERIELGVYGDLREIDVKPILAAAVTGVLRPHMAEGLTLVNALEVARERKIEILESTSSAGISE